MSEPKRFITLYDEKADKFINVNPSLIIMFHYDEKDDVTAVFFVGDEYPVRISGDHYDALTRA